MTVHFLQENTPEALLAEIDKINPEAWIMVYLHDEEVVVGGKWRGGRIRAMGMLADALASVGGQDRFEKNYK